MKSLMRQILPWKIGNPYIYFSSFLFSIPLGSYIGTIFATLGGGWGESIGGPFGIVAGLITVYCATIWLFGLVGATIANMLSLLLFPDSKMGRGKQSSGLACLFIFVTPMIGVMFWFLLIIIKDPGVSGRTKNDLSWFYYYKKAEGDPDKILFLQVDDAMTHNVAEKNKGKAQEISSTLKQWLESSKERGDNSSLKQMYFKDVFKRVNSDGHIEAEELDRLHEILGTKEEEIDMEEIKRFYRNRIRK